MQNVYVSKCFSGSLIKKLLLKAHGFGTEKCFPNSYGQVSAS